VQVPLVSVHLLIGGVRVRGERRGTVKTSNQPALATPFLFYSTAREGPTANERLTCPRSGRDQEI
jgi:hypothetical protein